MSTIQINSNIQLKTQIYIDISGLDKLGNATPLRCDVL